MKTVISVVAIGILSWVNVPELTNPDLDDGCNCPERARTMSYTHVSLGDIVPD